VVALLAKAPRFAVAPFLVLLFLAQAYFWGAWAAFSVALTTRFTAKPEVTWDWLYWLAGFSLCTSLVGWFASKERATRAAAEQPAIEHGAMLYWVLCAVCFIGFGLWPSLMQLPYGWFTGPFAGGASEAEISDPFAVHCRALNLRFTLGRDSAPSESEVAELCQCIWNTYEPHERSIVQRLGQGAEDSLSEEDQRAYLGRFKYVLQQCGGMEL
jgi:hypothetical protein